jgi:hypothetical protein
MGLAKYRCGRQSVLYIRVICIKHYSLETSSIVYEDGRALGAEHFYYHHFCVMPPKLGHVFVATNAAIYVNNFVTKPFKQSFVDLLSSDLDVRR